MSFDVFWKAEASEKERLKLCVDIEKEMVVDTILAKRMVNWEQFINFNRMATIQGIECPVDPYYNSYLLCDEKVYDESLIQAMAGDWSAFAAIAERSVKEKGLYGQNGKLNNYVLALQQMGYPSMNCFMYAQYIREKKVEEANKHLNEALRLNEPFSEYFYGCEMLRRNKRRKGRKIMEKIGKDERNPFWRKARALRVAYQPVSSALNFMVAMLLGGSVLMIPIMTEWGLIGVAGILCAILCIVLLGGVAPVWDKAYRYAKVKKLCNFDGVKLSLIGELAEKVESGDVVTNKLHNYTDYEIMDEGISFEHTSHVYEDKSELKYKKMESVRGIISQVHEKRIQRKQYYMNLCQQGDEKAKVALLVLFDTAYQDGKFVTNREFNPCPFIPELLYSIID